jgi:hypothetical protein
MATTRVDAGRGHEGAAAVEIIVSYTRTALARDVHCHGPLLNREDVIQDVFALFGEKYPFPLTPEQTARLRELHSDERKCLRESVRKAINRARYLQGRDAKTVELPKPERLADPGAEFRTMVEERLDFYAKVQTLDPQLRRVFLARKEGRSVCEIASREGITEARAYECLRVAKRSLARMLSEGA